MVQPLYQISNTSFYSSTSHLTYNIRHFGDMFFHTINFTKAENQWKIMENTHEEAKNMQRCIKN